MPQSATIITTVYNAEAYVAQTIESVLAQTRQDFQYVLYDDGSTDHSLDICREYVAKDDRITLVPAVHAGSAKALAGAHDHAGGKLIGWVDSDDMLEPEALELTSALLDRHPQVGMVYTHHNVVDEAGTVLGLGKRSTIPYDKTRMLVDFMAFHFRLFRREVYDRIGGVDRSYPCAHDYDFALRMTEATEVRCLPRPLYRYRMRSGSISMARRLDQIRASERAVRAAMQRRGLDQTHDLDVELRSNFTLRRKPKDKSKT